MEHTLVFLALLVTLKQTLVGCIEANLVLWDTVTSLRNITF